MEVGVETLMNFPRLNGPALDSLGLAHVLIRHFIEHFATPLLIGSFNCKRPSSQGLHLLVVFSPLPR